MVRSLFVGRAAVLGSLLLPVSVAQSLNMEAAGGSMPGVLALGAQPVGLGELAVIIPSTTTGPTPISLIDPNDPRSFGVGADLLALTWIGFPNLNGRFEVTFPLTAAPSLQDQPIFFQAATLLWSPTLFGRLSGVDVVRLGNADSFRDRFVGFADPRAFATTIELPDRRYLLVGGARGQLLAQSAWATTEIYDPVADFFSYGPSMSTPRSMHTMTQLNDGRWLVVGGVDGQNNPQGTCEIYDPATNVFTAAATMASPRMGHTATLLADGRVFVAGGLEAVTVMPSQLSAIRDAVDSTEIYDPASDTWSSGPNMSDPRAAHFAIVRPNGDILLGGGISWDPNILFGWVPAVRSSCDLYSPGSNSMSAGPSMGDARSLVDPVDLGNDRWLLAGGIEGLSIIPLNPGNPTASAEVYDAALNTWTAVGSLATARANHKSWSLGNGQFLLAGGASNSILSPTSLSTTEVFSTTTNTFSAGPSMNVARAAATAFATPHGQMMLIGGSTIGNTITNTTEWYYY